MESILGMERSILTQISNSRIAVLLSVLKRAEPQASISTKAQIYSKLHQALQRTEIREYQNLKSLQQLKVTEALKRTQRVDQTAIHLIMMNIQGIQQILALSVSLRILICLFISKKQLLNNSRNLRNLKLVIVLPNFLHLMNQAC